METGGEYAGIQWIRTPRPLNIISDQLVDYDQTFVMTPTSINDSGIYTINLVTSSNTTSASASINFTVMFGTPSEYCMYVCICVCMCMCVCVCSVYMCCVCCVHAFCVCRSVVYVSVVCMCVCVCVFVCVGTCTHNNGALNNCEQ